MRHVVVMVTTSYPRFPGDSVGTFMEPIAKHVAARGHEVHIVAPWHPRITRGKVEDGVYFHFFRYAPVPSLNVFGYAAGLQADVKLKSSAWMAAPLALAAGWFKAMRVAQKRGATVMHGHWVVPGGGYADFVDTENWDFYPNGDSDLVNSGDPSSEAWVPETDFNGVPRDGDAPDVGAYEFPLTR